MTSFVKKQIKQLPQKPGAYLFKDAGGRILYIGKAINLKKRVQTHFSKKSAFFGVPFIDKVEDIDWMRTKNEAEAMLLEDQLIKKYKPRYNIQWKDDKSYFWVSFSNDEWPRVEVVHNPKIGHQLKVMAAGLVNGQKSLVKYQRLQTKDQTGCQDQKPETNDGLSRIGPFVNGRELRQVLRVLRRIFPYRTCKNSYEKPCLQWHLGLCPAHSGDCHSRESGNLGPGSRVKPGMTKIQYFQSLNVLRQLLRLYAGEPTRIEAYDISNIQGNYATGSMIVFCGDKPSKSDYRKFRIKTVRGANDVAMFKEVIRRRFNHIEWSVPDLILVDGGKAQLAATASEIKKLGYSGIGLISLAKREEEIYTEYSEKPLRLSRLPEFLRLTIQHIRDEAHRFAIFYYRYLHDQAVKIRQIRRRRTKNRT